MVLVLVADEGVQPSQARCTRCASSPADLGKCWLPYLERHASRVLLLLHVLHCRVLQAAVEVLHKALQTLHMKAEVRGRGRVLHGTLLAGQLAHRRSHAPARCQTAP